MKVISIRMNDQEESAFNKQIKKSGLSKSRFMKARLLSDSLTARQENMKRAEIQSAYADLLLEFQRKGISLNQNVLDNLGKAVSGYVSL